MSNHFSFRQLTTGEQIAFQFRHPSLLITPLPPQGIYVRDEVLKGFVLLFKKARGEVIYVWTNQDPTSGDPNAIGYIASETLKAAKEATANVLKVGSASLGIGIVIFAIFFFFVYVKK